MDNEEVIRFEDYSSPEELRKKNMSTHTFLKKLFLDIGNQCMYLQKTSELYISELLLKDISYNKEKNEFYIVHPEKIMKEKSDEIKEEQWMYDLANMMLSFIDDIEKLNGSSVYYAILRCQDKEKPRFIYV